jgi:hypothetical protein
MEMESVNSSNLAAIGYDNEAATLRIEFLHGGIYDISTKGLHIIDYLLIR